MATNPAEDYGRTIACPGGDADALWTSVAGIDVVIQDTLHVLTTDNFLGPGGTGRGYDTRKLLGAKATELAGLQPVLTEVVERDDRILSAEVILTATTTRAGLPDVVLTVRAETALGPFEFTKSIASLTTDFAPEDS